MDEEKIEHSSGNVFADLGLPDAEEMLEKSTIVSHLNDCILLGHTTLSQVAQLFEMPEEQVKQLLRGRGLRQADIGALRRAWERWENA